jgi:SM-20-related protein
MPDSTFLSHLGLFVFDNFLEREQCARLSSEMRESSGKRAPVGGEEGSDEIDEHHRRTKLAQVTDDSRSLVMRRLFEIMPLVNEHFNTTLVDCQKPQFLVYREGDFFRLHADNDHDDSAAPWLKERKISAVAFLNAESEKPAADCYGGGALTFYGLLGEAPQGGLIGLPVTGKAGSLIAFPSGTLHDVSVVSHGERCTLVTWFV